MFSFLKRATQPPWLYLGWSQITFQYPEGDQHKTVHFYGRGEELAERRFEYEGEGKYDLWVRHTYIQQGAIPWREGNSLWSPIRNPSEHLKEWTKKRHGYVWKAGQWYKPAEHTEGNVLKFPQASDGAA